MGEEKGELAKVSALRDIKRSLPDIPIDYPIIIPHGMSIDNDGVAIGDMSDDAEPDYFSSEPFVISKKILDLEEATEKWEVTYRHEGKWRKLVQPRLTFADPRKLLTLADYSFPVDGINLRNVLGALRIMAISSHAPLSYCFSSCGWKFCEGKTYFVWGKKVIGAVNGEVQFLTQDPGTEQVIRSYRMAGTLENWMSVVEKIFNEAPKAMMAIYHSLAPPLMKICGASNFCVDLAGSSSVGKTTFSRIAASVWGAVYGDNELLKSWNSTRVFGERLPAISNDMPIFLEETQLAKEEDQSKYLYMIVNGVGKGRGNLAGIREVKTWNTCLFSTGEIPLSQSTALEGVRARTVPYWGSPFGESPVPDLVKAIESGLRENHGIVGQQVASHLLSGAGGWSDLKSRYEAKLSTLTKQLRGNIESRVASYMALTWLAADIFHEHYAGFFPSDFKPDEIIFPAFEEIMGNFKDVSLSDRALHATKQWVIANKPSFAWEGSESEFLDNKHTKEYYGMWRNDGNQVYIYTHKLKAFLRAEGMAYESVIREWKRCGVTETSPDRSTMVIRVNKSVMRVVALNWSDLLEK